MIGSHPLTFIPGFLSTEVICPLCKVGSPGSALVGNRQHLSLAKRVRLIPSGSGGFFPLEQSLLKCSACSVCYLYPLPTSVQIEEHYKLSSLLHGTNDLRAYLGRINADQEVLTAEPKDVLRIISSTYEFSEEELRKGYVADIGCNAADFLAGFRMLGFNRLLAVEPDPVLQERNLTYLGCDIHIGLVDSLPETYNSTCTFVSFRDTLEHLVDPTASIERVWKLLRPGGFLYIKVPNFNCTLAQSNLYEYEWFEVDHLFYFSPDSVRKLLLLCGFERIHTQTIPSQYDLEDFSFLHNGRDMSQAELESINSNQNGRILQAFAMKPFINR